MGLSMGMAVGGEGPPALAGVGTVWYDLSSFGIQSLTIPANSMSLSEGGGGLVDDIHLRVSLCEPIRIEEPASHVDACDTAAQQAFDAALAALHSNTSDVSTASLLALAFGGQTEEGEEGEGGEEGEDGSDGWEYYQDGVGRLIWRGLDAGLVCVVGGQKL